MALLTALIIGATAIYAVPIFKPTGAAGEARAPFTFWTMLMAIWCALNIAFLSNDLFNLYVALELMTFAAVPLVSLDGRRETLEAALRYLLFALVGSVLYLLGTAIVYGTCGTLDIGLLSRKGRAASRGLVWAVALMTAGLLAKTALFPLHLWLPKAHAGAPAAASAVLSALVVKGSFLIVLRLWFDVLPGSAIVGASSILGGTGGSRDPRRQRRRAAAGKTEASHRLFDRGADRLSLSRLSARRGQQRPPLGDDRLDRRHSPALVACLREGGDVPGRGPCRRGDGS